MQRNTKIRDFGAILLCGLTAIGSNRLAQAQTPAKPNTAASADRAKFDLLADGALQTMKKQADEKKVVGVAVLAYFEGDTIRSWASRMLVVGQVKKEPVGDQKGSNLLAIAYAKAAEMADTLQNSGSKVRPPMTGEVGWEGGVIFRVPTGYLIAAFSGGQSSDDVAISRAGAAQILEAMKAESKPTH